MRATDRPSSPASCRTFHCFLCFVSTVSCPTVLLLCLLSTADFVLAAFLAAAPTAQPCSQYRVSSLGGGGGAAVGVAAGARNVALWASLHPQLLHKRPSHGLVHGRGCLFGGGLLVGQLGSGEDLVPPCPPSCCFNSPVTAVFTAEGVFAPRRGAGLLLVWQLGRLFG